MEINSYFKQLEDYINRCYELASRARKLGFDASLDVDISIARDLASRVEGLLNIKGVAKIIKEKELKNLSRIELAMEVAKEILNKYNGDNLEEKLDKALRVALAIVTEGVVSAPIEGIVKVKIKKNFDGTKYLAVYYAGPIRSAGGTAQALSVLFADILRREIGLDRYKPTEEEIERFVEEFEIYFQEVGRLQYKPDANEIRTVIKNIPVEITGEATEDVEVSGYRDLDRIETNKIRGGALLVIAEGILQKAKKLIKFVEKFKLDGWEWLKNLVKEEVEEEKEIEILPDDKYLKEIVAGRPVLCHPSRKGGFRLRYGRTRTSGLAAVALHPSTLILLDGFIALGTQIKLERPGKAGVVTVCDTIEPPVVRLKDGSVIRVEKDADKIKNDVDEILFLGDILIAVGEFIQNNHILLPTGYVEEFWVQELREALKKQSKEIYAKYEKYLNLRNIPSSKEAVEISLMLNIPLHPRYTYNYNEVKKEDLKLLARYLVSGKIINGKLHVKLSKKEKRILEDLLVPHIVKDNEIIIEDYLPLLYALGIWDFNLSRFEKEYNKAKDSLELVNRFIKVRPKALFYIGARMGRPEKSDARKMQPPVNVLFPLSNYGGRTRSVRKAAEKKKIYVEIVNRYCKNCNRYTYFIICEQCGSETILEGICPRCKGTECNCNIDKIYYSKRAIEIEKLLSQAIKRVGSFGGEIKGVIGLTSKNKVPEILEKGILRSKYGLYVFKDGTCRYDMTNIPLTHFKPKEINVSVDKLRELGYERDIYGNELRDENQILELLPQDIIVSEDCLEYLYKVSKFVDELLVKVYGLEPFYNAKRKEDLIGHLVIGLAPHTSCGIVGRIIGYTKVQGCFAHPYWHAAKRRNCFPGEAEILVNIENKKMKIKIQELYENFFEHEVYDKNAYVKKKAKKDIKVYSYDPKRSKIVLAEIDEVIKMNAPNHLVKIILSDGTTLITTYDHPVIIWNDGKVIRKISLDVKKNDTMLKYNSNGIEFVKVKDVEVIKYYDRYIYSLNTKPHHNLFVNDILTSNCDGDEDSVILLLDAFLNFSKEFLPSTRGGRMDAPLVINTRINPIEVDDEVHKLDTCEIYPLEFYLKTYEFPKPSDIESLIDNVSKRLGKEEQFRRLMYTHECENITNGPIVTMYKKLSKMEDKVKKQLLLASKIKACNEEDVAKRLIESHFIRDVLGNLRSFSTQSFRCTSCNKIYRRIPLLGKCICGGNLVLTVSRGAVEKYLNIILDINSKYVMDEYLKQRIEIMIKNIEQMFGSSENKGLDVIFNKIENRNNG